LLDGFAHQSGDRGVNPVPYVQAVKTASGATAVQIVYSCHRGSRDIGHIGSAQARL